MLAVCISWKIDNMAKWVNSSNDGNRDMKFGSFDSGKYGEYSGAGLVEIFKINEYVNTEIVQLRCVIDR